MSEIKRVMSTLFKTELATQKVELALTDDIDKYLQKQNTVTVLPWLANLAIVPYGP